MISIPISFPARVATVALGLLLSASAMAAPPAAAPQPRAVDGQKPTLLVTQVVRGRISKPSVTIILGRNFRAPTGLMSAELWRARDAKAAAARR